MSYADVNGVRLYYEEHGSGGTPLILLHGGIAGGEIFGEIAPRLAGAARDRADLQGHGRTADIDRPLRAEHLADDVAVLIEQLGLSLPTCSATRSAARSRGGWRSSTRSACAGSW